MFGRRKIPRQADGMPMIATGDIDVFQRISDPKEDAEKFILKKKRSIELTGKHLWQATGQEQIQLALARTAFANDRTAEILTTIGRKSIKGADTVPEDIQRFALVLSQHSLSLMTEVEATEVSNAEKSELDEAMRSALHPESHLPYWPRVEGSVQLPWQEETGSGLSREFLEGIMKATIEFQSIYDAEARMFDADSDKPENLGAVPGIVKNILEGGAIEHRAAETYLTGTLEPSADIKAAAYQQAHDAYIHMLEAGIALVAPLYLGPDFSSENS